MANEPSLERLPDAGIAAAPAFLDAEDLLAQIRSRTQDPSQGTEQFLVGALQRLTTEVPSPESACYVVDGLIEIALYYLLLTRSVEAIAPARAAVTQARQQPDPLRLAKALRAVSWALHNAGQFDEALRASSEGVSIATRAGSEVAQAASWNMLGNVLSNAGHTHLASQCYELCLQTPSGSATNLYRDLASANMFTIFLMHGEAVKAAAAARALAARLEVLPDDCDLAAQDRRALLHAAIAEALMSVGDLHEASDHIAHAQSLIEPSASDSRASRALRLTSALMKIARGEPASLDGIEAAFAADSTSMYAAVAVCESVGQYDTALEILSRLQERSKSRQLSHIQELLPGEIDFSVVKDAGQTRPFVVAARLESELAQKVDRLVEMAVSSSSAAGHDLARVFRMSRLATIAGRAEGLSDAAAHRLGLAAKLCDIGMIAIESRLLLRTGTLSLRESQLVSEHTEFGAQLLATANLEMLKGCIPVAKFHHERWDGQGPWRIEGERIPFEARLVALCDAFDTMTQARPWRSAATVSEALDRLMKDAGTAFEPTLCERFVALIDRVSSEHRDFARYLAEEAAENEAFLLRTRVAKTIAESSLPSSISR